MEIKNENGNEKFAHLFQTPILSANKCHRVVPDYCNCDGSHTGIVPNDDGFLRHGISAFDRMIEIVLSTVIVVNFKLLNIETIQSLLDQRVWPQLYPV